jgi:exosortase
MWKKWLDDPQYSHGYLVPAFALVLIYFRRKKHAVDETKSNWLWIPWIFGGLGLRFIAAFFYFQWLESASFVVCLAGIVALAGGRQWLRWAGPSLAFLLFMIPLPYSVETAFAQPLQRLATNAGVCVIRTAGFPALGQGNIIVLPGGRLGVEQACSGLSMLLVFLALSTAVIVVTHRPLLDKLVILASALPIAIIANVARIAATGVVQEIYGRDTAQLLFHDCAGFLMMPVALGFLALELLLLARLLRTPKLDPPMEPVIS